MKWLLVVSLSSGSLYFVLWLAKITVANALNVVVGWFMNY